MMAIFAVGANALHVALIYILSTYFNYHDGLYSCAVGFSAVLFGLKVVLYDLNPDGQRMYVV